MAVERLPSTGDAPGDSAGFAWEGRNFDHHGDAFSGDDGSAPAEYVAAIARLRAGGDPADIAEATRKVIGELAQARLLVPLVAEAGELGETPDGRLVDKTQELSIVTVAAPDGRRVMPAFTSAEAMNRWNTDARPIPVPGPQAALAAAQEGTDLIIIDPGSADTEFGVRRTQLRQIALGESDLPAWADPQVHRAFAGSCVHEPRVVQLTVSAGDPQSRLLAPEVLITLELQPGLDSDALNEILGALQEQWSRDETIAERVDSMQIALRRAPQHP